MRVRTGLFAVLALIALACEDPAGVGPSAPADAPDPGVPTSMVALGDSLSVGFASCVALVPCPRNSFATGDGTVVNSHYRRILATNPAIRGRARNVAVPNATSADLAAQAGAAVRQPADYVTVLIGANDACRPVMTEPKTFRARVDAGLAVVKKALPQARVLVISIPDVYRVWEVAHTNGAATRIWSAGVCPPLLADPTSTAPEVVRRRQDFRARIDAYNSALEGACRAYGSRCRTDGGAVHRVRFSVSMLAVTDFFHPNVDGQARLADASWPGRFTWGA